MKSNIKATVIESPGKLGNVKVGQLAIFLAAYLSNPETLEEVNKHIAEKKEKESTP